MEPTPHALLLYPYARQTWAFWQDCPMDIAASNMDILDIASQITEKGNPRDLDIFFMTAWTIWEIEIKPSTMMQKSLLLKRGIQQNKP